MNTMKNSMYLLFMISLFLVSCDEIDFIPEDSETPIGTCTDGILNQNEEAIDCGGICSACAEAITFEEGEYRGLWNSIAENGSVYTDLFLTAIITEVSEGEFTGSLYISDDFTSCCDTPGDNGDGPLTISIVDGNVNFTWSEVNPGCIGEFRATGMLTETNRLLLDLTGNDCEGDHVGSIEFFE